MSSSMWTTASQIRIDELSYKVEPLSWRLQNSEFKFFVHQNHTKSLYMTICPVHGGGPLVVRVSLG